MEPALNPYNPGSGVAPPHLGGRQAEIEAFDLLVARTKLSRRSRPMVLSGLRGVGKTVLLNRFLGLAEAHEWLTIKLEGRPGPAGARDIRKTLARELQIASRKYAPQSASEHIQRLLRTVSSFSATVGVQGLSLGVDIDPARASTGFVDIDLRDLVEDVGGAMRTLRRGFTLFIDEMQDVDDELLGALVAVQHHAVQRELPFFVIGAGLPNLPARLAEVRSYAERLFDYRTIGKLAPPDAAEAFTIPAGQMGQTFSDSALKVMVEASGRYPYFIQEFGNAIWEVATESPFSLEDAEAAAIAARQRLDSGFFPSRWDRATAREREYMTAMAEDGEGPSITRAIAERMGTKPTALGPIRAQLIDKGLVYSPEHGQLAFTVPGMADFIQRQYLELHPEID